MIDRLIKFVRKHSTPETRRAIIRLTRWPPVGMVRFGNLRRTKPISKNWGSERGTPVDRYYISQFLTMHSQDIQGHVLEVGTDRYSRTIGKGQTTKIDVLHVEEERPEVTIVGDLTRRDHLPSETFNCVILTQTLQFIYDVQAAVQNLYRILKPGGIALVTVSGISQIGRYEMDRWGQYWSFTTKSVSRLFETVFPQDAIEVISFGNVLTATAFLYGLASEDLRKKEKDLYDPDYQLVVAIRVTKPEDAT